MRYLLLWIVFSLSFLPDRKSVALDAANANALFRIGIIASEKGDSAEVHAISLDLTNLNKDIAKEFSQTVGCDASC